MKSYRQVCPIARALDAVGERWSLLIIRDLIKQGPLRFQDLERALPGIAPNVLSARIKRLEEVGAVGRRLYAAHPPRYEYFLTDKGEALRPVIKALWEWGEAHAC
jgi:DNA-binding HxlR family transcriptional regulator